MNLWALFAFAISSLAYPSLSFAQAHTLMNSAFEPVSLPYVPGKAVALGSVSLGSSRSFTMFNIQAAGTIAPDPDLNGTEFQLQLLICDKSDCTGAIMSEIRILPDWVSDAPVRVIATRSFGLRTHNAEPVLLTEFQPRISSDTPLYLAVALKLLHGSNVVPFTGRLNLVRVDTMP